MSLKQTRILAIIGIFILNILFHFAYSLLPNTLFAILFPVNESIFEHMKLIFSSALVYGIIDYFILKKNKLNLNNIVFSILIGALTTICIFLIIWLPIYYRVGENMILTFIILLIAILLSELIKYWIIKKEIYILYINIISIIGIIIVYILIAYLTYNPPKNKFFFDPMQEKYGIDTYVIK